MKLRRKFILEVSGDKTFQKCLVLIIILKSKLKTSRISNYTINKLCKLTGISHKTAEKYEKWLIDKNLIHFEGTPDNKIAVINRITSHTTNRNICIDEMDLSSFYSAYKSLQSFLFMRVQYNKDFIKHLLQARHNPNSSKDYRRAKKQVKDFVKMGKLNSTEAQYEEYGLSLKRIAKEVGCCVRTTQRVIDFAIKKKWVEKKQNFKQYYTKNVNYREVEGFTFATKNNLYIIYPNTYILSSPIYKALNCGMVCI